MAAIQKLIDDFIAGGYDANEFDKVTELCVLYLQKGDDEEKEKIGNGLIRVLEGKENGRYRVVMRSKDCKEAYLNHYCTPGIEIDDDGEYLSYKVKDFADPKGEEKHIFLKFPPSRMESANLFISKFKEGQMKNQKLMK